MAKMKAIVVESPGIYGKKVVEKPSIKNPDDVLIRVMAVGICGSDIHLLHGGNAAATYPRIPGHEIAACVEEVGSAVGSLKSGDRVIVEPIQYCGKCHACRRGRHNVCRELRVTSVHVDGGFCEYMVCKADRLHLLPHDIPYELAAAIEPCTIGAQANARAGTLPGDFVLIHGAGPIGISVLDAAKRIGAAVIVSEVSENRLKFAQGFGADYIINPAGEDYKNRVMEITNGSGPNVIFDAAGIPALLPDSIELAATAGTIVPMSFAATPVSINCMPINMKELTICGTRHQYQMFPKVIADLGNRMEMLKKYVSHSFQLEEYEKAFELFYDKASDACKIVIKF